MNSPNINGQLSQAREIKLIRAENGWLVTRRVDSNFHVAENPFFVFESTESLAENLVKLVGGSKWAVTAVMPKPVRDEKGKFVKPADPK